MVDFKKTADEYKKNGLEYPDPTQELKRILYWEKRVTDENNNFNINPADKNKEYPRKEVTQIFRKLIEDEDNTEYLTTVETWSGRDGLGNDVRLPVSEPQCYQSPIVRTSRELRNGRYEMVKTQDGSKIIHTTPFTPEAFREVYNRSKSKSAVELIVKRVGRNRKEVPVTDPEDFVNRNINDLINERPKQQPSPPVTTTKKASSKVSTIEGEVLAAE